VFFFVEKPKDYEFLMRFLRGFSLFDAKLIRRLDREILMNFNENVLTYFSPKTSVLFSNYFIKIKFSINID
jgi:hypothetical protein